MGSMTDQMISPAVYSSDEERWAAIVRRDPAADGRFFYSVKTTGVYCRPSCASRRARRENVRFHDSPADAERAGFRACRRCRPNDAGIAARYAQAVAHACRLIERSEELPGLAALASACGMSPFHFHRVFKSVIGLTPKAYAGAHRVQRVRSALALSTTVTEAIYGAGFGSSSRFYAGAGKALGMSPARFRSGGRGTRIRFALGRCSLGSILVAATERGVCAISLGEDPEGLIHELEERFPQAALVGADREFERLVARVVGFIEAPRLGLDLPLDIRGSAFQQRVWRALCAIPAGSTATYSEIARRIGAPKAVRAVARACATNGIAVAIPCHRVVRNDGSLAGYRWGLERKRALIERESDRK